MLTIRQIEENTVTAIKQGVRQLYGVEIDDPVLTAPPDSITAEYAFPCFQLARHARKSPASIAEELGAYLDGMDWIDSASAMGPYLNICIHRELLVTTVIGEAIRKGRHFGGYDGESRGKILVEYSSPNTNKPLHLGHIRNNVLGMAVIRMLRMSGYTVIPATILNDRGIHICKAMVAYREHMSPDTPETNNVKGDQFVGQNYVMFDRMVKENPEWMDTARQMLKAWEDGDPEVRELWKRMNDWVYRGFETTYRRLGSEFQVTQYESDTYTLGRTIVQTGLEQGVFFTKEDGSVWIDLSDAGLDEKAIIRADGTTLYLTQDLGVAVERAENFSLDAVIYVVGSEQNYHFKVLFETLKRLGYPWSQNCQHLSYGMVYLPEGKMKSREGKVVDADDLMDQMQYMALQVMDESHIQIDPAARESIAESIGVGAIKYYILKVNPQKDIHFDPRASLSFDGATGAYIQYAHARICSILRKAGITDESALSTACGTSDEALDIVRAMMRFPSILETAAHERNPSKIAVYSWELAKLFNVFYTQHRILDAESRELRAARLDLCRAVAAALKSSLGIMGIDAVERM